jgi:hypothetical protein
MASRRWCSFSPEAESGGRPSSVIALLPYGQRVTLYSFRLLIFFSPFELPLYGSYSSPHAFFELLFSVAIRFEDCLGRFPEVMKLTQLVGHLT